MAIPSSGICTTVIRSLRLPRIGEVPLAILDACFKSARFRSLNFAELIYSEVGFCFCTTSVESTHWCGAPERQALRGTKSAVDRIVRSALKATARSGHID